MRTGMSVTSPCPTMRFSMRRSGSISGGACSCFSFARAASTPSEALKVIGIASTTAFSVGSISGRAMVGSVMGLPYKSLVQRRAQCGQSAVHRIGGRGDHPGIAEVAMHHRLGVVHLDGNTGGGEQLPVAHPVVAQRIE